VVKAGVGEEKTFPAPVLRRRTQMQMRASAAGVLRLNGFHAGRFADPDAKSAAGFRAASALWGE
jgi:hypothetical protein